MRIKLTVAAAIGMMTAASVVAAADPWPGFGEPIDAAAMITRSVQPGDALLYVSVGPGVSVSDRAERFRCNDNAHCVFTVRAGSTVVLTGTGAVPGRDAWKDCEPSIDFRRCVVTVDREAVRVALG